MNKAVGNEIANNMNKTKHNCWRICLLLLSLLTWATSADALPFSNRDGDLCLGFRKTGTYQGLYEIVVDIGPATNYLKVAAGSTINVTQYSASQINPDSYANFTNLSWSVVGDTPYDATFPAYPVNTLWVTVPRVGGVSASGAVRASDSAQSATASEIESIWLGAVAISSMLTANKDNTTNCVQEPYSIANGQNYGAYMADPTIPANGTLQGFGPVNGSGSLVNLENTTVAPFSTAVQSDLYQLVPNGATDPQSGTSSGGGYNVGYFQLNPDGTMTFTRASTTIAAPVAGFSGTPTNGFAPLSVVFTDASTGSITNWLWNLGDGVTVTNTSNASVNHTYSSVGSFTVSLKVTGPGGANTATRSSYIATASTPRISGATFAGGKLVFGGANGPAGVQYRILNSTNLASANWKPVATNFFLSNGSFSYTNSTTNPTGFFRLVSP